jgi:hypothetical protein
MEAFQKNFFSNLLVHFVIIRGRTYYLILSSAELLGKMIHILVELIKGVIT